VVKEQSVCTASQGSHEWEASMNEEQPLKEPRPQPLAGIRVLELGHNIMGPACGLILADLGADVYKVERPGRGDDTRWLQGFGAGFFTCFNRNKKSLGIDLKATVSASEPQSASSAIPA